MFSARATRLSFVSLFLAACSGTTSPVGGEGADAGAGRTGSADASPRTSTSTDGGARQPSPSLLVTFTGATKSETVVVNPGTKHVEGRLGFPGFGITDARNAGGTYLLEQNADIVALLDPTTPWQAETTWDVRLADGTGNGSQYADPVQVVSTGATSAYLLRYYRNDLVVLDTAPGAKGGAPTTTISLDAFVQPGDVDGVVEMTAGVYVPATGRLYVVLGNINQVDQATNGGVVCGSQVSTVLAIDTQTRSVVALGGTGPGGSVALTYYAPLTAVYDPAGNRLIVVGGGCASKAVEEAALGPAIRRGVESIDLTTGVSTSLLDLTTIDFPAGFVAAPSSFTYIDSTHAILAFDGTGQAVYSWDPTSPKLGALIPYAPDVFTYDGAGHLVGARSDTSASGAKTTDIVSVDISTGVSTMIAANVSSLAGTSYVASVDLVE